MTSLISTRGFAGTRAAAERSDVFEPFDIELPGRFGPTRADRGASSSDDPSSDEDDEELDEGARSNKPFN